MKIFRKAILIIHGFAGGTYDEEYLNHKLELINNYDVYTFTLPGHDGNFNEKITSEEWIKKCDDEMKFLIQNGYKSIYVIGHSMGGVLAAYLASKYKEVKKLVLVAPAFRIFGFEDGNFNITNALSAIQKIFEQYGLKIVTNRMMKLPANCYLELLKIIKNLQGCTSNITTPTLIFRGTSDTVVPNESIEYINSSIKSKYKKIVMLDKVTHDVLRENKKGQVAKLTIKFFRSNCSLKNFPNTVIDND